MNSSSSQPPIQPDKVPSLSPLPPVPTRLVMARFAIKTAKSISFTLYEWDTAKYKTLSNVGDDCLEEVENAICKEKGICSGKRHGSWNNCRLRQHILIILFRCGLDSAVPRAAPFIADSDRISAVIYIQYAAFVLIATKSTIATKSVWSHDTTAATATRAVTAVLTLSTLKKISLFRNL